MARPRTPRARCSPGVVTLLLTLAVPALSSEIPRTWRPGFVRARSGERLVYPWAYPGQAKTLLSRATDGRMAVEWEGEALPDGPPGEPVTFLWHAGTASGYGAHAFTLSVDGRAWATFRSGRTSDDREWTVPAGPGATLSFRTTRVGTFRELFGFMWLTAPRSSFGPGAPRFAVVGEAAQSQDYYLGPEEPVVPFVRVRAEEAVLAGGMRAARLEVSRVGEAAAVTVRSNGRVLWSGRAGAGYTSVLFAAGPDRSARVPLEVEAEGERALLETLAVRPVRPREIHLLPHSHIDVGYSDPQPEVERKQWKNLRDAVALGARTASYPPAARFKWSVEGLWSVESYLRQASPEERRAFVEAVGAGTVGLVANTTNLLTGLATPEELRHWTDGARRLRTAYGLPLPRSAMHTDIPGLSAPVVAALAEAGVRYLSSGPNYMPGLPDGGDRIGRTLRAHGDAPFWWTSPSGEERLLFWMAGRGYSWFHGMNAGGLTDRNEDGILDYVRELAEGGYPWDLIQVRYTVGGDNGPVDPGLPDAVKAWNERFLTPRLVIDTVEGLFAEMERRHGSALPVKTGDMTPYWEDGASSTAAEEGLARASARRRAPAERAWALRNPARFPADEAARAWGSLVMWHEHTWGAADSISEPDRADVVAQWEYKRAFVLEADRGAQALLDGVAVAETGGSALDVLNTLSWPRSDLVLLSAGQSRAGDRVSAGARVLPSQRLRDGRLAVWVEDVPGLGSVRLRVEAGSPGVPAQAARAEGLGLDNGRVRLALDAATAHVASLRWAGAPAKELAGPAPGVNRYLYVPGRDPAEAMPDSRPRVTVEEAGPLVATIRVESDAPGTEGLVRRITVVAGGEEIGLEHALDKTKVRAKESAHVAFPFDVPGGVVRVDQGEALFEAERTQLPGSCRDFVGAPGAGDVSGAEVGVSVATLDAPLFEPGAMTDERTNDRGTRSWREHAASGPTLYAYLLNNYWHTNYKADQSGRLLFRFVLRPHGPFDPVALQRFSDEQDQPLFVLPGDPARPVSGAPFALDSPTVGLVALTPIEGGSALLARLYNPSDQAGTATIRPASPGTRVFLADGEGRPLAPVAGSLTVPPRATRRIRIEVR